MIPTLRSGLRMKVRWIAPPALAVAALLAGADAPRRPDRVAALKEQFLRPPDDARIMMRWWWFGAAVTKAEIEREMRQMKESGIGGFEIQPVYPLELDRPGGIHNLPFLSPEFLEALGFAGAKARELGLRVDL